MLDCFPLRFNLDECGCAKSADQPLAITAMFGIDHAYVKECAAQFSRHVSECAARVEGPLRQRLREKYAAKTVAFFGDSITSDKLGYARIAAEVLPQTKNFAVSCSTSANVLYRLKENLADGAPHTAVVFIGTNDAAQCLKKPMIGAAEYESNLGVILEALRPCARRILLTLPGGAQYSAAVQETYNAVIGRAARRHGCDLLDLACLAPENRYEPDGVHLSVGAQEETARLLLQKLDQTNE